MLLETLIIFLLFVKFDPRPQPRLHFGLLSVTIVDWILICSINTSYYITTFATMILDVQIMLLEGAGVVDWLYSHLCSSTIIVIVDFLSNSQTKKKKTHSFSHCCYIQCCRTQVIISFVIFPYSAHSSITYYYSRA